MLPVVLTIAGSDSSAGAGIQADLKAIAANGAYGASAITAITAQNTLGVHGTLTLAPDLLQAQIEAVFGDLQVAAVKTGMLADATTIGVVREAIAAREVPYVCDPVMLSKSGHALLADDAVERVVSDLFPLATLVTPNVHEARRLSGMTIETVEQAEGAGRRLLARGAAAVLVKGGHLRDGVGTDVLVTPGATEIFAATPIDTPHTHGTGCTYSAAIAARLARGEPLVTAVRRAKQFLTEAIRYGLPIGGGPGPTDPFWFVRRNAGAKGDSWIADLRRAARATPGAPAEEP